MEIWKPIKDYEGLYEVSNLGRVKSLPRLKWNGKGYCNVFEKIMKPTYNTNMYFHLRLSKNGISKVRLVHQLVAESFLNHNRLNKLVVHHINDIKTDNRVGNLQVTTQRDNSFKTQGNYSSNYKGVCWNKQAKKWQSNININGKSFALGLFKCELAASVSYQNKLKTI